MDNKIEKSEREDRKRTIELEEKLTNFRKLDSSIMKELNSSNISLGQTHFTQMEAVKDSSTNQSFDVDFKPREYQVEIVNRAIEENVIVYLPTGSGKTFIATMFIKYWAKDIECLFSAGGKRSFFLVNTVALVAQQAESLRRQLPFSIGEYSGDKGVDIWDKEKWKVELDENNILVMTAQIFLDILLHNFINLSSVNLILFDECHHSVNDHPMRQIMKQIENYQEGTRPHIMGLTATLLNGNCKPNQVEKELRNLENTMMSKIVTALNNEMVKVFSANPKELLYYYEPFQCTELKNEMEKSMEYFYKTITGFPIENDENEISLRPECSVLLNNKKKTIQRRIFNSLNDIKNIFTDLGLYAADKAILIRIIQFEKDKLTSSDANKISLLNVVTTRLHLLRHQTQLTLARVEPQEQIFRFASPKLKTLYKIFLDFDSESLALVFVEQRITAQVLHHIFKDLRDTLAAYQNIKPNFIVGCNANVYKNTVEGGYERMKNTKILESFSTKKINVLFASDVVEEGIDIRLCNYVIKFDEPKTYRSYIQSKGRARHSESKYIFLSENSLLKKKSPACKLSEYKQIEECIRHVLCKDQEQMNQLVQDSSDYIPPYYAYPGGPCVTAQSAISLVNRYCSLLPQDKFSKLTPYWWIRRTKNNNLRDEFVAILQLPVNSALKEKIESRPFKSGNNAKRCVALMACERLHKLGELDDNLFPTGKMTKLLQDESLFPMWDSSKDKTQDVPGTKKCQRVYNISYPQWVCGVRPKPEVHLFLHVIVMKPNYQHNGTNKEQVFYNLLDSDQEFAILTTKKWPELCQFSLHLNVGEVIINLAVNAKSFMLSAEEIKSLRNFHNMIFTEAYPLINDYHVMDHENKENSYMIVPTTGGVGGVTIDWDTVKTHTKIPDIKPIPSDERKKLIVEENVYKGKIVIPWYRSTGSNTRYVVCEVKPNLTPASPFPNGTFTSFGHYFERKYEAIAVNTTQPLLEVRGISKKLNCLLPRGCSKNKRGRERLEEILIPELCILLLFPTVYILKLTLIPSLLHRVHYLLLAEELRQKIIRETNLGIIDLPRGDNWKPLLADNDLRGPEKVEVKKVVEVQPMNDSLSIQGTEDLLDIERDLNVDTFAIKKYNEYVSQPLYMFEEKINYFKWKRKPCPMSNLSILEPLPALNIGPQLCDMLQVLTSKTSCDIVNYERLETLGDSFLKFAVSLALFVFYPSEDEGKLTQVKGKIIGNRNLFYCGRNLNLGGILKIFELSTKNFDTPGFVLMRSLQDIMREDAIPTSNLISLRVSKKEREEGVLSDTNLLNFLGEAVASDRAVEHDSMRAIRQQIVADKTIADAVEALIGLYLKSHGVDGAFKLLRWLGILCEDLADINRLLYSRAPSPLLNNFVVVDDFIVSPELLEERLGYKFQDRSFLLQAISHPSAVHNVTDCYQRFEFLGDSILDFLITTHIYDKCGFLSPGEITDLRSALVNNVTFACLTVRYGFHKHLIVKSYALSELINRFVQHQESSNHSIGSEIIYLVKDDEVKLAEMVDVPKVLGDLFEALAAAVFLDSNKNFGKVWSVFYQLMENEIQQFSNDVPINPVRLLYETFTSPLPKFGSAVVLEDTRVMMPLQIIHKGKQELFHGLGENKSLAREAAAKIALKYFEIK